MVILKYPCKAVPAWQCKAETPDARQLIEGWQTRILLLLNFIHDDFPFCGEVHMRSRSVL